MSIQKAHDKGIKIIIATGRATGDLHEINAVSYDGIIALNGADCVFTDGTILKRYPIAKEDFRKAMEIAKEFDFPGCVTQFFKARHRRLQKGHITDL